MRPCYQFSQKSKVLRTARHPSRSKFRAPMSGRRGLDKPMTPTTHADAPRVAAASSRRVRCPVTSRARRRRRRPVADRTRARDRRTDEDERVARARQTHGHTRPRVRRLSPKRTRGRSCFAWGGQRDSRPRPGPGLAVSSSPRNGLDGSKKLVCSLLTAHCSLRRHCRASYDCAPAARVPGVPSCLEAGFWLG